MIDQPDERLAYVRGLIAARCPELEPSDLAALAGDQALRFETGLLDVVDAMMDRLGQMQDRLDALFARLDKIAA